MLGYVVYLIVEHHLCGVESAHAQIVGDVGQRVGLHLDVGLDAAAVAHDTAVARAELLGQAVRYMLRVSAAGVPVVYCLDATVAGDIILSGGQLQLPVVGQVHGNLHEPLAVGPGAEHHGTVEVLHSARRYLAGGCRLAVHHHHDGHHRVYRLHGGLVVAVHALHLAAGPYQRDVLRHKHVDYLHSLAHRTAAIAAQVEHEALHPPVLQVDERAAHVLGAIIRETVQVDIPDAVGAQPVIWQIGQRDGTARDAHLHRLARGGALYLQEERGAWVAAQMGTDERRVLVRHHRVVDAQDDVALLQPGFRRRTALIRLVDDHPAQFHVLAYHGTDAHILAREHVLQAFHLLLGIILRIRVERAEHSLDAVAYHLVGIQRVHVDHVEIAVDVVEHLDVLRHLEIMVFVLLRVHDARRKGKHKEHC